VCLENFDWMPDIVNYTLWDAEYICVPINIVELWTRHGFVTWTQFDFL
jgi:hypothetical protein